MYFIYQISIAGEPKGVVTAERLSRALEEGAIMLRELERMVPDARVYFDEVDDEGPADQADVIVIGTEDPRLQTEVPSARH